MRNFLHIEQGFPLVDLHRHLDSNIRVETILDFGHKFSIPLPAYSIETLRSHVQVMTNEPDLTNFLQKQAWGQSVLGDLEAVSRVAFENVEDLHREGIDYAELRFSPYQMAKVHNLNVHGVIEAVVDGVEKGRRAFDVGVNLIGSLNRQFGAETALFELEALLAQKENLVAIDLAGDEANFPPFLFKTHFDKVRHSELHVTVNAGVTASVENIWYAIKFLGAKRIGHGIRAMDDPLLIEYLVKHRIGIEASLTANVQTGVVESYEHHPIRSLLSNDVLVSMNAATPAVSGIELIHEYQYAAPASGLNAKDMRKIQRNGVAMAFLSDAEKNALMNKLVKVKTEALDHE